MTEALEKARREAEAEIGFEISDRVAEEILNICRRKLAAIRKDESYLPTLFRHELPLKIQGYAINALFTSRKGNCYV